MYQMVERNIHKIFPESTPAWGTQYPRETESSPPLFTVIVRNQLTVSLGQKIL